MLVTMLTAMYMMVRVVEQLGVRWIRQQEPLPYMVSQPLPWQIHYVSQSRRGSRTEEYEGRRRNSMGVYRKMYTPLLLILSIDSSSSNGYTASTKSSADAAAATIQHQYRKYQQKKHKDHK